MAAGEMGLLRFMRLSSISFSWSDERLLCVGVCAAFSSFDCGESSMATKSKGEFDREPCRV
jgi:hypothetical protein